jgi:hypothetical protein
LRIKEALYLDSRLDEQETMTGMECPLARDAGRPIPNGKHGQFSRKTAEIAARAQQRPRRQKMTANLRKEAEFD